MYFSRSNIDRSIIMTQYDLRGFSMWGRIQPPGPKNLSAIAWNLAAIALGYDDGGAPEHDTEGFPSIAGFAYAECQASYQAFATACKPDQREAIQLIIFSILDRYEQLMEEVREGARQPSNYLEDITEETFFGKTMLGLIAAFEGPSPDQLWELCQLADIGRSHPTSTTKARFYELYHGSSSRSELLASIMDEIRRADKNPEDLCKMAGILVPIST